MAHIKRLAFCGIRRLNVFRATSEDAFVEWRNHKDGYVFGKVNIFIGANGGGKTTVIDLLHSLRSPVNLVQLPRENKKWNSLSAFEVVFSDLSRFIGQSAPNEMKNYPRAINIQSESISGLDIQFLNVVYLTGEGERYSFARNISKLDLGAETGEEIGDVLSRVDVEVNYWSQPHNVDISSLCTILNRAAPYLPGILSHATSAVDDPDFPDAAPDPRMRNPFRPHDDRRVAVWLSDDLSQTNHIHIDSLPAGWRRLASIVNWLANCARGSVCLIEEPETHLHPTLQRHLAHEIDCYVRQRGLQVFIATHSTVFQQMNIWKNSSRIFAAEADRLVEYSDSLGMLDRLGIKASDISQSNGVIWVEGASDRLYIKHWLELWCRKRRVLPPLENVEYSFCFYGGSSLSHFTARETKGFVEMLKINRNFAIVVDNDLDFAPGPDGTLTCLRPASAKGRILDEIPKRPGALAWVTEAYTIENYLPAHFFAEHFSVDGEGRTSTTRQKVNIAKKHVKQFESFDTCTSSAHLERHMAELFAAIRIWNHQPGESLDRSCVFAKDPLTEFTV